jgi:hypothetical protein
MNGTGYKILGYAVWHAGKWYLRRRLPSARVAALAGTAALTAAALALLLGRRLTD